MGLGVTPPYGWRGFVPLLRREADVHLGCRETAEYIGDDGAQRVADAGDEGHVGRPQDGHVSATHGARRFPRHTGRDVFELSNSHLTNL